MLTKMLLAFGLCLIAQDQEPDPMEKANQEREEAAKADEKIRAYSAALREVKSEADFLAAVADLCSMQHKKIRSKLTRLLSAKTPTISRAVADELAKYQGDPYAANALVSMALREKDAGVAAHYLKCAGETGVRDIAKLLPSFFNRKVKTNVALQAVNLCGQLKSRYTIEPLIKLIKELERIEKVQRNNNNNGWNGGGGLNVPGLNGVNVDNNNEEMERKNKLLPAAQNALRSISNESWSKSDDWTRWWVQNRGKWKEPEE